MSAQLGWIEVRVHSRPHHLHGYLRTFANFRIHRDVSLFSTSAQTPKLVLDYPGERGTNVEAVEWSGSAVEIGPCARDA